jgi:hypothetical protein
VVYEKISSRQTRKQLSLPNIRRMGRIENVFKEIIGKTLQI